MKLYIALCQDRHEDALIKVFKRQDSAIEFCKKFMEDNRSKNSEIKYFDIDGWLFHATYAAEGDSVTVMETELQK